MELVDFVSTSFISKEILDKFETAQGKLIPAKSKQLYEKEYDKFCEWKSANNVTGCNEKILMAYLSELSNVYKPSSLWCIYSKLKLMIKVKQGVDVSKFFLLTEFMKKNSVGDEAKKSLVLERRRIEEFILNAPDKTYLLAKVVAVFGMFGACRREELHDLCVQDITSEGSVLVVHIRRTKTYVPRTFTIISTDAIDYVALYNKYAALPPEHVKVNNLFLSYHGGKCVCQIVGKNTLGKLPRMIAEYLKLPNADKFTGHCFRRSAATILAESGGDTRSLKQLGGWRSDTVAESYVENSLQNKIKIAQSISGGLTINKPQKNDGPVSFGVCSGSVTISNPTNCTFNFGKM